VERYRVLIKLSAKKEILGISTKKDRRRLVHRIEALSEDPRPHGCEKLSGYDRYRLRQGQYRILYQVFDDEAVVSVVKVGHRRDVYRAL